MPPVFASPVAYQREPSGASSRSPDDSEGRASAIGDQGGDIAKAVACGADAVMIGTPLARAEEAPGHGWHWGPEAYHGELPRGARVRVGTAGPLRQVLFGPSDVADGSLNLAGALRRALAATGYSDLKEFQRVEVVVSPA